MADFSLFIYNLHKVSIYVLVFVDDIIVMGPSSSALQDFITTLAVHFSLKDLGDLSYFLGVEVLPHPNGLFLCQQKYINDILVRAMMKDAKPVPTPMVTQPSLTLNDSTPLINPTDYRALVGSLQYLSLTRPNVSFVVNRLSQYMHKPTDIHWAALKRLLRYLNGTSHHGLVISRNSPLLLHAFSDADWAGDRDTYTLYYRQHCFSWS